jgi:hypothetical protein
MIHKTIWMVSGNKGGVGKSLFCLALASALGTLGEKFSVLDGDGRTGDVYAAFARKCPARQGDFRELRPESHNCSYDGLYEGMLHALLRTSTDLIINTPDGADSVLLKWFDVTLKHTESNNYQFKFIYLMSDRADGLDTLGELAQRFQFLYPVRNLHFGPSSLFDVFNRDYAPSFKSVLDFPVLRGDEARMLFAVKTYPSEAISLQDGSSSTYTVPTLMRARLSAWQNKFNEVVYDMIDNKDTSNLQ